MKQAVCRALKKGSGLWALLFWIGVWQAAAMLLDSQILLVSPVRAVKMLIGLMGDGSFYRAVGTSVARILTGFLLACLLAVGLIHSALAYILYFSALRELPGQEAAVLSYIDPLVAVLISLTVLAEPVAPVQLVGGAMILAFTLANEL